MAKKRKTEWQAAGGGCYWIRWSRSGQKKAVVMLWGKQWETRYKNRANKRVKPTEQFDTKEAAMDAADRWLGND